MSEESNNKQDKEGFFSSKLFAILLTFVITALATVLVGWLIVNPMLKDTDAEQERIMQEEKEDQGILSIRKIEFDPTGEKGYNITFVFNQDVVEKSDVGKDQDEQYFSFNPEIPEGGVFIWETPSRLMFKPNNPLLPSTKYTIKLNRSAFDFWEGELTKINEYEIQTLRLAVSVSGSTISSVESKNIIQYKYNLYFNQPVTPEQVKQYTKVTLGNETLSYEVEDLPEGSKAANYISITTEEFKKIDQVQYLNLTINKDIKCLGCTMGLEKDYQRSTRIDEKEYLIIYDIAVFTRSNSDKQYIKLSLSHQVSADEIKPYISIEPKVDYTLAGGNYYLEIDGDFEPNETYTLTISKGYEAIYGAIIKEDIVEEINMGDLQRSVQLQDPLLDFTAPGVYLPIEKTQTVSVNTINVDKVRVEIQKIFANNLVYFLQDNSYESRDYYYYYYYDNTQRIGKTIYSDEMEVESTKNMRVYTDIDISQFISDEKKGIYKMIVRDDEYRYRRSTRWLVATDIGIVSKKSGKDLFVWVNSLKNLDSMANVDVKLMSYTNQVIAEGKTDVNGIFRVPNLNKLLMDYRPYAIVAETDNDFSFLKLDETRLSTVDFDVNGSYIPDSGMEAFLYMDRNIFRPDDKANLVAVVRNVNQAPIPEMPVKLNVYNNRNQITHELTATLDEASIAEFNFDIAQYAITGFYRAELVMGEDNVIGSYRFQVEDFIPATIKVEVETNQDNYKPGEDIQATVIGTSLFGPPAANRKVQARFRLSQSSYRPDGYNSYTFGDYNNKSFSSYENSLGEFKLDENGQHVYTIPIRENVNPPSILRGTIQASVFEPGGRAVTKSESFNIYPYDYYIGVKRNSDYYVDIGIPVPFAYVILDKDGKEVPVEELENVEVKVTKSYWVNILKKGSDGKVRYQSERREETMVTKYLSGENLTEPFTYVTEEGGRYTVTFSIPEDGTSTSMRFYAYSWGGDSFSMEDPDKLIIETDKDTYQVGDTANVIIKSPFAGKLMLTVERESMLYTEFIELEENTANIELPIVEGFAPNAYISGTIIRSIDYVEPFTPVRAFGVVPINVEQPETNLEVTIDAPEKMEPNNPITIELTVPEAQQDTARVTVAAVDEGILQLTNYQNPDPHGFFYRKRALEMDTYDLYSFIIPDEEKIKELYSNPGDMATEARDKEDYQQKTDTKRVKPTSLWSGIVELDNNKKATVTMDVPEFNGTLRIMAVAVDRDAFGAALDKTIVRAPIVLSPTLPRFLSIGDSYVIPVGVYNDTGADADITVTLDDNNMVEMENPSKTIFVRSEEEEIIYFNVKSTQKLGDVYFTLSAEGNGKQAEKKIEMPQRSFRTLQSDVQNGSVSADQPVNLAISEGWIDEATEYTLTVSSVPAVKFVNSLKYLLRYPYGCAEQTTSKAFPLLYFKDLAEQAEPGMMKGNSAEYYVERAIRKLEAMQRHDGSIAYWPSGNYTNEWTSIYVAHFLVEAKKAGHQVSQRVLNNLMGWLKTVVNRAYTEEYDGYWWHYSELHKKAYAHYVLALAGDPQLAGMFYIKNNLAGHLHNESRYFIMGGLAMAGQVDIGKELMKSTYEVPDTEKQTGGNFYSTTRSLAIMLNVLAEIDESNPLVPRIIKDLEDRTYIGRWYNTQENAYALLAIGKIYSKKSDDDYTLTISDQTLGQLGSYQAGEDALRIELGANSNITLTLEDEGEAYYSLNTFGIPTTDIEPYDKGIKVRRQYLDANQNPVNLENVKVGQLVVAEVTISANKYMDNVVILDMLPAGFEIENPRLASTETLSWASSSYNAQYMDMRDDRLLLFSSIGSYEYKFYYTIRAVTEGTFTVPAIMAEAMYNPDYASLGSTDTLIISQ